MIPCLVWLLIGVSTQVSSDEPAPVKASLCELQRGATEGEQRSVQVTGTYSTGFEASVLTDPECPTQRTWVEWDLRSKANEKALDSLLDSKRRADVVLVGDFFGPSRPDPSLPEALRRFSNPYWGHLGGFKTKLVVHVIRSVKAGK